MLSTAGAFSVEADSTENKERNHADDWIRYSDYQRNKGSDRPEDPASQDDN